MRKFTTMFMPRHTSPGRSLLLTQCGRYTKAGPFRGMGTAVTGNSSSCLELILDCKIIASICIDLAQISLELHGSPGLFQTRLGLLFSLLTGVRPPLRSDSSPSFLLFPPSSLSPVASPISFFAHSFCLGICFLEDPI